MRNRLDSINILDKATATPVASSLESNLERTLDKIRRDKITPGKQSYIESKGGSKNPSPYKERESPSFGKLLEVLREKKSATASPYKGKFTPKSHADAETSLDRQSKLLELLKEKVTGSPSKSEGAGAQYQRASMEIEYTKQKEDLGIIVRQRELLEREREREQQEEENTTHKEGKITPDSLKGKSLLEALQEKYAPHKLHKSGSEHMVNEGDEGVHSAHQHATKTQANKSPMYNPEIEIEFEEATFETPADNKKESFQKKTSYESQHSPTWQQTLPFR